MFLGLCFRYWPTSREAYDLRGGPFFEDVAKYAAADIAKYGTKMYLMDAPEDGGIVVSVDRNCAEIWFALMPQRAMVEEIESRIWCNAAIVDYHGDVLQLSHNPSAESVKAGRTIPDEAWQWWYQPEQQETMKRALRAAAVVTTPWPHLVERLKAFNPRVVLLRDYRDKRTRGGVPRWGRFAREWTTVIGELKSWYVEKAGESP